MGIKQKAKNTYKKAPSKRKPLKYMGALFKVFFALCIYLFISLVFLLGYDQVVRCQMFNAKAITVEGNKNVSDDQIINCSRLNLGENIFSMNLSAAEKHIGWHPMVATVDIKRDFPSGISIHVKEHTPIAVLDMGRMFAVNSDGEIFMETSLAEMPAVPVIVGFTPADINASGKIDSVSFEAVMTLLHLGSRPSSMLPVNRIRKIRMDKHIGLTLDCEGRMKTIRLGYGNYANKIKRLKAIYDFLNKRPDLKKFISIDLINLNRMVLKSSRIG